MARELMATRPVIYNGNGRLNVQWYVHFKFKNPYSGKMERFKVSDGINSHKTHTERLKAARNVQAKLWRRLKAGHNPFDDKDCLYTGPQVNVKFNKESIRDHILEVLPRVSSSHLRKTTVTYKNYCENFFKWLNLEGKIDFDISLISEDDAHKFLKHLSEEKQYSAKHRNEHLSLLKRIFAQLKRRKVVLDNPFEYCLNLRHVYNGRKFYRDGLRNRILNEMDGMPQLLLFCEMVYYTLRRVREIRLLQLKEIHLADGRIEIPASKSKTGKPGFVTIPDPLLNRLLNLKLHEYPGEFYLFGSAGYPASKPTGVNYFRKRFKKIKELYGLGREYGIYNFKHTGAIKADRANIPHKDIQQQGGWTSLAMFDVYMQDMDIIDSPQLRHNFPDIRSTTESVRPV